MFFFSSRRRHTRLQGDWSSDVCSSDLRQGKLAEAEQLLLQSLKIDDKQLHPRTELAKIYQREGKLAEAEQLLLRSEERRVGEECSMLVWGCDYKNEM